MKKALEVTNAEVVDWKATFQTVEQLKAAITAEAAKTIEVENASGLPTAVAGAKTAIEGKISPLKTGTGLAVTYEYPTDTEEKTYFSKTENSAKYENVTIKITKDDEEADSVTVTFNWAVKAAEGAE